MQSFFGRVLIAPSSSPQHGRITCRAIAIDRAHRDGLRGAGKRDPPPGRHSREDPPAAVARLHGILRGPLHRSPRHGGAAAPSGRRNLRNRRLARADPWHGRHKGRLGIVRSGKGRTHPPAVFDQRPHAPMDVARPVAARGSREGNLVDDLAGRTAGIPRELIREVAIPGQTGRFP